MAPRKTPAAPADAALRIEYLPLDQLARWPGNPKEHADGAIAASISRFGFRDPLAIDEATGRLIAGHGRLSVLERAHAAGQPAPQFVQVREDGMWLVPVTRGGSFGSEDEAAAYLVAHNRTGELGGWNDELLAGMLGGLDDDLRAVAGFDLEAFVKETDAQAASAPALPEAPSEFLNDLIGVAAAAAPQAQATPTPAAGGDAAPAEPAPPAAPVGPGNPEYVQVVYVVPAPDRDLAQRAVKRAREQFGVATAPEAFMAIIRAYLSEVAA
ncbi:hypothetical protein QOL99_00255 [Deinococcus sp. MIMF12]|uniref:ParB/Sulfiredoxin domain-containing protein n=1 Tax=Deinococcus rhizophilus TaxID=3049544 RepID=A0ABT7JC24_9DEIO|nr:hypothetical protein [Deinococcus rhizophilus]MDL2342580.1 hypothetical protein [Deinococcus rhizophilus]